jgi:hypothetical protein
MATGLKDVVKKMEKVNDNLTQQLDATVSQNSYAGSGRGELPR